jgi:GTP-binding protein LepA
VRYFVETVKGDRLSVERPAKLPQGLLVKKVEEPYAAGSIITPKQFLGPILTLINTLRGSVLAMEYQGNQVILTIEVPLSEIVTNFYGRLKNVSSGFASLEYELAGVKPVEVVKLDILVAKKPVDALSQIVVKEKASTIGKALVEKLREVIPRQQFEVSLQAAIGSTIIARADIPSFRKDVTAKLYGGDRTRKDKLLEEQKKGKKRMKRVGNVEIPQDAFLSILKL